ncbi:riboflavin biosynthesis protein RibA [Cupriavidus sp. 30B13]|uniref:riboflavin biosynthesis protein RibA n=1 Tax=Cupriavidus sp. 30B13 TaxID=3384241 RepID=UPI003B9172C0
MVGNLFYGERARTKIAALFDDQASACHAVDKVRADAHLNAGQVRLVEPHEPHFGRKLEPEEHGIERTAIRAHLAAGVIGLAVGLLVYAALRIANVAAVADSPGLAMLAAAVFGLLLGLMAGGLLAMRPDHQAVITPVREAVQAGRWAVIVHPASPLQCDDAMRALGETTRDLVRSF